MLSLYIYIYIYRICLYSGSKCKNIFTQTFVHHTAYIKYQFNSYYMNKQVVYLTLFNHFLFSHFTSIKAKLTLFSVRMATSHIYYVKACAFNSEQPYLHYTKQHSAIVMTLLRKACPLSDSTSTQAFTDCFIVLFIEPKDKPTFKVNAEKVYKYIF